MEKTYTVTEAASILNRTVKCLQLWDRHGKLKANRTKTNRRFYTADEIKNFLNIKESKKENRKIYAYCRVSSQSQKQDLKNQRNIIEEFCISKRFFNVCFVEEIAGGLNFKRKQFYSIINDIINNKVEKLILAHKDRFCRFGFELIEKFCEDHNCELLIINSEKLSPEEEMVQDLMTIIHCFSSRLYGLRNYKKSLKKALKCN
jgi:predicted site-specific integrase-resolvase